MDTLESEINRRATNFCRDNAFLKRHQQIIETAMLIGASIVLEQGPCPIPGESEEGWQHVEEVFTALHGEGSTPRADTGVPPRAEISLPPRAFAVGNGVTLAIIDGGLTE